MKTTYLTLTRRLFVHDLAPRSTARHNMRAWVRSVRELGPNWRGLCVPTFKIGSAK